MARNPAQNPGQNPARNPVLPDNPALIASYFTLAGDVNPFAPPTISPLSFADRAEAAAAAGFRGIGIGHQDIAHLLGSIGAGEIRRILSANGLDILELEVLLDWYATGARRALSDQIRATLLRAASELGAIHIKVAGDRPETPSPISHMADAFGDLCDEAAAAGTGIVIELYPASEIANLATGCGIVNGAGRANGGLLLDIWHMMRGGVPLDAIAALPPHIIRHIELDDADAAQIGTVDEDTVERRRWCGEGDLPVADFLNAVAATGYAGAWGVEILSAENRMLDVREAARRAFDTTRRFFPPFHPTAMPRRAS